MKAVVPVQPGRYFVFIAYVYGEHERDWLATAYRDSPDTPWTVAYRFKYYGADPSPWSGEDERSYYEAQVSADEPEERLAANVRLIARALITFGFNDRLDWLDVRSDDPHKVLALLSGRPWAHAMKFPGGPPS